MARIANPGTGAQGAEVTKSHVSLSTEIIGNSSAEIRVCPSRRSVHKRDGW